MNPVEIAVNQIDKPCFVPTYIINRFSNDLFNDAELLGSNKISKFDFEMKIKKLIKTDFTTPDGYFNNYISNHYYKFDKERNIYLSSLSSVYECVIKFSNYGFPKFLGSLNNEFEFNHVIYNMVEKHAQESIKIHHRLSKKNPGYTFHSLHP
jgi:hypothetical protein